MNTQSRIKPLLYAFGQMVMQVQTRDTLPIRFFSSKYFLSTVDQGMARMSMVILLKLNSKFRLWLFDLEVGIDLLKEMLRDIGSSNPCTSWLPIGLNPYRTNATRIESMQPSKNRLICIRKRYPECMARPITHTITTRFARSLDTDHDRTLSIKKPGSISKRFRRMRDQRWQGSAFGVSYSIIQAYKLLSISFLLLKNLLYLMVQMVLMVFKEPNRHYCLLFLDLEIRTDHLKETLSIIGLNNPSPSRPTVSIGMPICIHTSTEGSMHPLDNWLINITDMYLQVVSWTSSMIALSRVAYGNAHTSLSIQKSSRISQVFRGMYQTWLGIVHVCLTNQKSRATMLSNCLDHPADDTGLKMLLFYSIVMASSSFLNGLGDLDKNKYSTSVLRSQVHQPGKSVYGKLTVGKVA